MNNLFSKLRKYGNYDSGKWLITTSKVEYHPYLKASGLELMIYAPTNTEMMYETIEMGKFLPKSWDLRQNFSEEKDSICLFPLRYQWKSSYRSKREIEKIDQGLEFCRNTYHLLPGI